VFEATYRAHVPRSRAERERWLVRSVILAGDDEMDCEEALDVMSAAAETHAGCRSRAALPVTVFEALDSHLRQCEGCADVLATLLDLVGMEGAGELPDIEALWCRVRSHAQAPAPPSL